MIAHLFAAVAGWRPAGQVAVLDAAVRADAAAIENAQVQLDYATIMAPIDAITGMRMVDVGNVVSTTDPAVTRSGAEAPTPVSR
jgi:multidrug efflux system membrane fusion protein